MAQDRGVAKFMLYSIPSMKHHILLMICYIACICFLNAESVNEWNSKSKAETDEERWNEAVGLKNLSSQPSLTYFNPNPALPDVLIIGDSISMGYTPVVRKLLAAKANIYRIPANGMWTSNILAKTPYWFQVIGKQHFKVIVFNSGLHDITRIVNGQYDASGSTNHIPLSSYTANLDKLVDLLQPHTDILIWASTTSVPVGAKGRKAGDEIVYNDAASGIMNKRKVPIIDLYAVSLKAASLHMDPTNVHYTTAGYELLGSEVAKQVLEHL